MNRIALVRACDLRKARSGKNFASLTLNLGSEGGFAELDGKIWDVDRRLESGLSLPASGDVIEITGLREDEYQGRPQWILNAWRTLGGEEREALIGNFTPESNVARADYIRRLDALIEAVAPESVCGIILREIFDWPGFREAFCHGPAARGHHQAYPGGLLEHTVNVTTVALSLAEAYAPAEGAALLNGLTFNGRALPIDRGVLIASGLLHDIGKLDTYEFLPVSEVTEANSWEGHLVISYYTVRAQSRPFVENPPYPGAEDEINKLLNCILAHHGSLEWGSPVTSACVEAFLLSQADVTDARLSSIHEGARAELERNPQARWAKNLFHFKPGIFIGNWNDSPEG